MPYFVARAQHPRGPEPTGGQGAGAGHFGRIFGTDQHYATHQMGHGAVFGHQNTGLHGGTAGVLRQNAVKLGRRQTTRTNGAEVQIGFHRQISTHLQCAFADQCNHLVGVSRQIAGFEQIIDGAFE